MSSAKRMKSHTMNEIHQRNTELAVRNGLLQKGHSPEEADYIIKAMKDTSHLQKKVITVTRDGKTFRQTVYVKAGKEEKKQETPIGEELSPEVRGMEIRKYSDKAFTISGDTYVNIDTLREIKKEINSGVFSSKLKSWIFPIKYLETVLGYLWSDQINKGNDEKAQAIQNQKNAAFNEGDETNIQGEKGKVDENVSDSEGTKYNVTLNDGTKLEGVDEKTMQKEPEKDDKKISDIINNTTPEGRVKSEKQLFGVKPIQDIHKYSLSEYMQMHGISQEDIDKAIAALTKPKGESKKRAGGGGTSTKEKGSVEGGMSKRQLIAKLIYKHYQAVKAAIEAGETMKPEVLATYNDLKEAYANKERKPMSEETKRKISEALKKNKVPEDEMDELGAFLDEMTAGKEKKVNLDKIPNSEIEKLEKLKAEKEKISKEKYALYDKAKGTNDYKEKEEIKAQAREKGREADKLEVSIMQQENVIKAYEGGGGVTSHEDKVGIKYDNLPDFTNSDTSDIDFNVDNILEREKPTYIPNINEDNFRKSGYIFDVIKAGDDKYLLATNGYNEFSTEYEGYSTKKGDYDPENGGFVALTLDQLVLTQDYYTTKQKAKYKQKADEKNKNALEYWNKQSDKSKAYYLEQKGLYKKLSAKQKKEISEEKWDKMSWQEREKYYKPIKRYGAERLKTRFDEDTMAGSFHSMYERFVNPEATRHDSTGKKLKRGERPSGFRNQSYGHPDAFKSWRDFKETLDWKINDIRIQREEITEQRSKALETSYGEANVNTSLVDSLGIKVKRQNGEDIQPKEIEQLKKAWESVQGSFGALKENAKSDNLKLSHAGKTYMFASKAIGVYVPRYKTIGVTAKYGEDQLGFTMGHEVAHWIDNTVGKASGRRHASDNYDSTAGKIANIFRKNMNEKSKSNYTNATHECMARAFEQYHAIESYGEDAKLTGTDRYFASRDYVNKGVYEKQLKPLIEQFLSENKDILKAIL